MQAPPQHRVSLPQRPPQTLLQQQQQPQQQGVGPPGGAAASAGSQPPAQLPSGRIEEAYAALSAQHAELVQLVTQLLPLLGASQQVQPQLAMPPRPALLLQQQDPTAAALATLQHQLRGLHQPAPPQAQQRLMAALLQQLATPGAPLSYANLLPSFDSAQSEQLEKLLSLTFSGHLPLSTLGQLSGGAEGQQQQQQPGGALRSPLDSLRAEGSVFL
jgi:hypothetical protein